MTTSYQMQMLHSKANGFEFYDFDDKRHGPFASGEECVAAMNQQWAEYDEEAAAARDEGFVEFPHGEFPF